MLNIKVIGIDPASAKGIHYCTDDKEGQVDLPEAQDWMKKQITRHEKLLICWDAPLTGPPQPVVNDTEQPAKNKGHLTIRPIERFFYRRDNSPPPGISTLGYSGLTHWTISRFLLGLPRVGAYDLPQAKLPLQLLCDKEFEQRDSKKGSWVTEVHPALAIWLWCKDHRGGDVLWNYKKDKKLIQELWEILRNKLPNTPDFFKNTPKNDDVMDARVAYMLGKIWVAEKNEVKEDNQVQILGNQDVGSFLLPYHENTFQIFSEWLAIFAA